jgi:hypothetical protein
MASEIDSLVEATREFIRRRVMPLDDEFDGDITAAGGERVRIELQAAAREGATSDPAFASAGTSVPHLLAAGLEVLGVRMNP